ncbi:MAG TPA: dual specificity protein phosphatase family protein [Ktedonosporobacter sp.]|nr:dual specificity protein phosphatase family protein [Ktedonosporobacter sp.]
MRAKLYSIRELPAGQISIMARPRGGDWLLDEVKSLREAGVDVLVSLLTPEEVWELDLSEEAQYCSHQGIIFVALPIQDRSVLPFSDDTFKFLEQLNQYLFEGKHVALHCRQGLGRAALVAASLLVQRGYSPDQAFDLLSKARGYPVPETEEQKAWVVAFFQRIR